MAYYDIFVIDIMLLVPLGRFLILEKKGIMPPGNGEPLGPYRLSSV